MHYLLASVSISITWCHCFKTNVFPFTKKWTEIVVIPWTQSHGTQSTHQIYLIQYLYQISQPFFYIFFPWPSPKVQYHLNFQSNEVTRITMSVSPDGDRMVIVSFVSSNHIFACNTTFCLPLLRNMSKKALE